MFPGPWSTVRAWSNRWPQQGRKEVENRRSGIGQREENNIGIKNSDVWGQTEVLGSVLKMRK